MKKKMKRMVALGLAAVLLISAAPAEQVWAMESRKETNLNWDEEKKETSKLENDELEEREEVIGEQKDEEQVITEEPIQENQLLLNYVFLENEYIECTEEQKVLASIGDENANISEAVLEYKNETTGEMFSVEAESIVGDGILFNLPPAGESQKGIYSLQTIQYTANDDSVTIILKDIGIDVKYGVETEVDGSPDAYIVDEEDLDLDIVSFDEDGNQISEDSIESAIENAKNDVASNAKGGLESYQKDANSQIVVVLDPGHDSTHAGASYYGYKEEDLVLKIAQYCKAELEKYNGVTVYMTRSGKECAFGLPQGGRTVDSDGENLTYTALCNKKRVQFAASKNADVFVSFHLNANNNTSAHGAGVYYPNSSYRPDLGQAGKDLANKIFANLNALGLSAWAGGTLIRDSEDNTVYPDGSLADYLAVIRRSKEAGIPAVLIEHAFLSNPNEVNSFLSTDEQLKKIGIADATAIAQHFKLSQGSTTYYNGIDYKDVYNYDYYINKYADMRVLYGNDRMGALRHFVEHGMSEGRQGSAEFDVYSYKSQYVDLRMGYGNDLKSYYMHYVLFGKTEGRKGSGCTSLQGVVTVYKGVDYSAVYDYNYYINRYGDMKNAYANDDVGAITHFVEFGMKEGRQGKASFDVRSYRNQYQDLRGAYGKNLPQYYMHYIQHGKTEGRKATGVSTIQNPLMVYKGVDYSAVYDYNYYINHYADMKRDYANDDIGAITHFVEFGMGEGRQGKADFDVRSYRNQYQDLRGAYGKNLPQYYMHYIQHGKTEGRKATGVSTIQNPLMVYKGVDYSAVYDYNYYINHYADMKRDYANDDIGAITHFVEFGMSEGRQGNAEFNVNYYRENYYDLSCGMGNDLPRYYRHYITNGKAEGRIASRLIQYAIMGNSNTSLNQMVAYYRANATYPAYYASSDAPNIETFCQMYIQECTIEGVRPEVAFCQAMKETGFLRYGGDVGIEQYNFAGLGATGGGNPGNSFPSVRIGIRAQIQHLKAYASTESLKQTCVDDRFKYVTRGTAPYVEWLGIQENPYGKGWATAKNYGYSIKNDYIYKLFRY